MPQSIAAFADAVKKNDGKFLAIFDFDGTVVDSEHISAQTAWGLFKEIGYNRPLADYVATVVGKTRQEIMGVLEQELGIILSDDFKNYYAKAIFDTYVAAVQPMKNVELALQASPVIALASNSARDKIEGWIEKQDFTKYFPQGKRFYADMVSKGKPAPDLFLLAAESMGVPAECCVVIGDSTVDMKAAAAAGMLSFGFVAGGHITDRAAHAEKLMLTGAAEIYHDMKHVAAQLRRFNPLYDNALNVVGPMIRVLRLS